MAINVLRFQSDLFVPVVKSIRANDPRVANAKYTDRLEKMLDQNE
jgi:hypothetical protein